MTDARRPSGESFFRDPVDPSADELRDWARSGADEPAVWRLDRVDYRDVHTVSLPVGTSAPEFCAQVLEGAPRWVEWALSARDAVAGRLGFHTQQRNYGSPVNPSPGAKFGPMIVRSVSHDRVVCGDVDRHLAFRATFSTGSGAGVFVTEVETRDRMGRAYFALVRPLHGLLMPRLIGAPFGVRATRERDEGDRRSAR